MCVRQPCPSCPWRVDQTVAAIPNFRLDLAEQIAATCPDEDGFGPDITAPVFACHLSRPDDEVFCAGWLAVAGSAHPAVRFEVLLGRVPAEALRPGDGWPELHERYDDVLAKLRSC